MIKIRDKTILYASYRKKEKKIENCFVYDIMKLENELHTTATFDLIGKKEISSKHFETGKSAGLLYQLKNSVG